MAERTCAACDCKLEGAPIHVRIGGRTVEVCCEDCARKLGEAQASAKDSRAGAGRALSVLALCVLGAAIGGSSQLHAATPDETRESVRVSYQDLDLRTANGVAKLYDRINRAARRVCKPSGTRLSTATQRRFTKCVDASMSAAALSVGNASLTSLLASAQGS